MFVIDAVAPTRVSATQTTDARLVWVREDDRGIELEIVTLDLADAVVVIQVMPTALRRPEMNEPTTYRIGKDLREDEGLRDSQGRLIDDSYVDVAVEEAPSPVRGRGRPSLSASGESPLLRVRLSHDLDDAVRRAAERSGASKSEWVRRALDEAVSRAS